MNYDDEMPVDEAADVVRAFAKAKGFPPVKGRFAIQRDMDGWTIGDYVYASCVSFETKARALAEATFYREYVRKHGDISLHGVPYSIDDRFSYRLSFVNRHAGCDPEDLFSDDHCEDDACPCHERNAARRAALEAGRPENRNRA